MGYPTKNEAPLAYISPRVKGALVPSHKVEIMTRKNKRDQFTSTRYCYYWCSFEFYQVHAWQGKKGPTAIHVSKGGVPSLYKEHVLLEQLPNRCLPSRFYLFCASCPLLPILPSRDSASKSSSLSFTLNN